MQNNTFSTLFVGQNLIKLPSVDSTNNYLKNLLSNSEPLAEGTVIMAEEQFGGRGQQNNVWLAEPGKNITMSVLFRPSFLKIEDQFLLSMAISVALNEAISKFLNITVKIKWPNDIYYNTKKIGGVLIENTLLGNNLKTSIVGIGLNVNQAIFNEELSESASSLALILNKEINLQALTAAIFSSLEAIYLQLKGANYSFIKKTYISYLYRYQVLALFKCNGEIFEGSIVDVENNGALVIKTEDQIRKFNFKQIEFINT